MSSLRPVVIGSEQRGNRQLPDDLGTISEVDLAEGMERLRLRCSRGTAAQAIAAMHRARMKMPEPWLAFLGSGDFHHVSLMLLESLPADSPPLTLILIDHHPDWFFWPPKYHCGNWVSGALALPFIERIVIVGPASQDLHWSQFYGVPLKELAGGRLELIPFQCERVRLPLYSGPTGECVARDGAGAMLSFRSMAGRGVAETFASIADSVRGKRVYVSIDKDCLCTEDAATDWEQGSLQLSEVAAGVAKIAAAAECLGADICGERAMSALAGFVKRLDAGRLREVWVSPTEAELTRNRKANQMLAEALMATGEARWT